MEGREDTASPRPIKVELWEYDPHWIKQAAVEAERLCALLPSCIIRVEHIGSTAVPGISAKPVLDLMPVIRDMAEFDLVSSRLASLGYHGWGEYGQSGRRFFSKDILNGKRRVAHLHCYQDGSSDMLRHVAFRDYLRENTDVARQYDMLKRDCQQSHPNNSHDYNLCKAEWIKCVEAEALAIFAA